MLWLEDWTFTQVHIVDRNGPPPLRLTPAGLLSTELPQAKTIGPWTMLAEIHISN